MGIKGEVTTDTLNQPLLTFIAQAMEAFAESSRLHGSDEEGMSLPNGFDINGLSDDQLTSIIEAVESTVYAMLVDIADKFVDI